MFHAMPDEIPLSFHLDDTAQQELPEAHHLLDDANTGSTVHLRCA